MTNVYSALYSENEGKGGAVNLSPANGHVFIIDSCVFTNITARIRGGAFFINNPKQMFYGEIKDSSFTEVLGLNGGIMFGEFVSPTTNTINITNVTISITEDFFTTYLPI